jgi:hypothetical protein
MITAPNRWPRRAARRRRIRPILVQASRQAGRRRGPDSGGVAIKEEQRTVMKNGPDGLGGGSDGHRWRHEHRARTPILLVVRGRVRRSPEVLPELWRRAAASGARSNTVSGQNDSRARGHRGSSASRSAARPWGLIIALVSASLAVVMLAGWVVSVNGRLGDTRDTLVAEQAHGRQLTAKIASSAPT